MSGIPDYAADAPWPPESEKLAQHLYEAWGAWYSGNPSELQKVYGSTSDVVASTSVSGGGVRGLLQRFWWGKAVDAKQSTTRLHVPIAADMSMLSSDLLYAQMPQFEIPGTATPATPAPPPGEEPSGEPGEPASEAKVRSAAERNSQAALDDMLIKSGAPFVLPESAEIGSAYGGRYIGTRVDVEVSPDSPMLYSVPPDCALPEWRYGRLIAVTFWRVVRGLNGGRVYRHLERHEVVDKRAMIYHALYEGNESQIGRRVDLSVSPATAPFAAKVDMNGGIWAGCSVLDVAYIPNIRPHRLIRGSSLGRSDYSGSEPIMDALDEAYSSWQRDIRLGKGRILVPRQYLESLGRGAGALFDAEREAFQTIEALAGTGGYIKPEVVQFAIRTADHQAACAQHVRTITRSAGLSGDAFGEEVDGGNATAKEIGRRGERTAATRGKKIAYETYGLRQVTFAMQEQAVNLIGGAFAKIKPIVPDVEFPDAAAPDPQTFALTLKALADAKAASTYTLVSMLHPEWDDPQIVEEVDRIDKPMSDPATLGLGGLGLGGQFGGGANADPAAADQNAPVLA